MSNSWQDRANELTQERIRQDHDDLNNDVAGRDTGRIKRFVSSEHIGSEAASSDDADFQIISDMVLQTERTRQERLQAAYNKFERYERAFDLAIAESERELQEAIQHKKEIFDNGTKLTDGRTVFIDEENGNFYDEDDITLSELDELEAKLEYKEGDSTRHSWVKSKDKATEALERTGSLKKGQERLIKSQQNLENGDITLDEFEAELEKLEQDDSLKPYLDNKSQKIPEVRQEASTSFTKDIDDNLFTDAPNVNLAFNKAHDNVQSKIPESMTPKPEQEMTLG